MSNKYKNKKIEEDGIVFDSQKEYRRYSQLKILEQQGFIKDLELQVKYTLIPAQYEVYERYGKNGKRLTDGKRLLEKEISYIADFQYFDFEKQRIVVEDVKSSITRKNPLYVAKRKMMLYFHKIKITEI